MSVVSVCNTSKFFLWHLRRVRLRYLNSHTYGNMSLLRSYNFIIYSKVQSITHSILRALPGLIQLAVMGRIIPAYNPGIGGPIHRAGNLNVSRIFQKVESS